VTLRRLLAARADADLALLAMRPHDPARYGRVLPHPDGGITRVVEWKDATEGERAVPLCNVGVVCAAAGDLFRWLRAVPASPTTGEFYLTEVVALARSEGRRAVAVEAAETECRGINSRAELAEAEADVQDTLRRRAMEEGATLTAPATVTFSHDTALGRDVTVEPNVVFAPGVAVEDEVEIRAFSHLEGCRVHRGAVVGPFARLRPGTVVGPGAHVGNFVELKATTLGEGAKANHLAYLGDAEIGARANVGAGTITCNYDGVNKHRTRIGAGAFVGSNATLVAPLALGEGAFVAAGSTVTQDVATTRWPRRAAPDAKPGPRLPRDSKKEPACADRRRRRTEERPPALGGCAGWSTRL
jgi:bifunctional UDP-N-acetylglucosamine pyrophosphorylase/glucosamine-1-phosphate N-acetyltransferase